MSTANQAETLPVQPKKPRFYYGWIIVVVSALTDFVSFGAGNNSLGVFLRPMSESLGWSRTLFTGAATLQSLGNVMISPIVGPLIDRRDPRWIMLTAAVIAAISYNLMGRITEPWQFYILYTTATALGLNELGILVTNVLVSKWFIRMRGRALAVISIGNNFGAIFIIPFTAWLVANNGWRAAWGTLGTLIVLILTPPVAIFMRRTPEDIGLRPDGDPPPQDDPPQSADAAAEQPRPPRREEPRWGVKDALRVRSTWFLVISANLYSVAASGMIVHQFPYLTDVGYSVQIASLIVALNHFTAIFSKTFWGLMAERFQIRLCLMACFAFRIVSILTLLLGSGIPRILIFSTFSGIGQGHAPLSAAIWPDYFGRASVGAIRGVLQPFHIFGSLGGPLFAAFVFDLTGSYEGGFFAYAASLFFGGMLVYFARPPGPVPVRPAEPAAAGTQPTVAT